MKKESKMIMQKTEMVRKRSVLVEEACEDFLNNNKEITYRTISGATNIPQSTLQRNPYKDIISIFRNINKTEEILDSELLVCRNQIVYLKDVIKQLNKENHELKTKLFLEGKIWQIHYLFYLNMIYFKR